jgi:hypothetical protein
VKKNDFKRDIKDTFNLLISRRMMYVMPLIIWSGLSQAVFSGSFVVLMNNTMSDLDISDNKKT